MNLIGQECIFNNQGVKRFHKLLLDLILQIFRSESNKLVNDFSPKIYSKHQYTDWLINARIIIIIMSCR